MISQLERFWNGIDRRGPDECWPYIGCASINWDGKMQAKRRVAWVVTNGPILGRRAVLVKCENGLCCNPAHEFLATRQEMGALRIDAGRTNRGEINSHAKLTEDKVREIRARFKKESTRKTNAKELAKEYGVRNSQITEIVRGNYWAHVK